MKLACNYSPQLMELLARGDVDVDYVKAGAYGLFLGKLGAIRAARPLLLHGMGGNERTGMPGYEALDFKRMNRLLREYGSPHLGIHLCRTNADAEGLGEAEIDARMVACALHFKRNLDVPLLLENTGDTPEERTVFDLRPFVEPERINGVLAQSGAEMLLDITHAKVTAEFRRWELAAYLGELSLGKVREIHITGSGIDADGAPYDAHGPMGDGDWAALDWTLGRAKAGIVTLEYGGPAGF
jgi:uncharacterized protein (UPF0276 family)